MTTALEELSEAQLLDHADEVSLLRRRAEVQELRIAVQHAVNNDPDTLDPELTKLPGRERARRYGGVGTPLVAEFCCATLAGRLGLTPYSAASLIADGLDLVLRLPVLWARVQAFEVRVSYARHVARQTRQLTPEQAAAVDATVAESADGRIPWTRFEAVVAGAVAAADPEAAAERERLAAGRQFANPTRSAEDGTRGFYIRAGFHVIALLDARVAWLADMLAALGDTDDVDHRRVKAIAVLANPQLAVRLIGRWLAWRDRPADPDEATDHTAETDETEQPPEATGATGATESADSRADRPARTGGKPVIDWTKVFSPVTVTVHTYRPACGCEGPGTGVVRTEGSGPVTEGWVRRWLGPHAAFTIRPVLDIEGQAPVDAYEIPERHRRAVSLMTPADIFPFASSTRGGAHQLDHTEPFDHAVDERGQKVKPGQSRIGNYGPMTAFHHRIKTHGNWQVRQPFPGIYLWRDPHGATYLVDHTGTRRVGTSPTPTRPAAPDRVVQAEIYLGAPALELAA